MQVWTTIGYQTSTYGYAIMHERAKIRYDNYIYIYYGWVQQEILMCKDKIIKSTPVACFLSSIKKWEVFTCRDLTDSIGSLAEDGRGLVSRHASKPIQLLYT